MTLIDRARRLWGTGTGPQVARAFQILFALNFLAAWLSLAIQILPLVGHSGLLPLDLHINDLNTQLEQQATCRTQYEGSPDDLDDTCGTLSKHSFPTVFWWNQEDTTLLMGTIVGCILSLCALLGLMPGLCFALMTALYLSYTVACRDFLGFQWDNMLIECGFLAIWLKTDRRQPWLHTLFRVVLFKVYWLSGIAKWMSGAMDWHDGTAMTFYYETAPLPTWLGWYAHNLPHGWHLFESKAALVLELSIPLFIFGPRVARIVTLVALTGFQLLNLATANYGFFVYLTMALHIFLLDDSDIVAIRQWLKREFVVTPPTPLTRTPHLIRLSLVTLFTALMIVASVTESVAAFGLRQSRVYWNDSQVHQFGQGKLSRNIRLLLRHKPVRELRNTYGQYQLVNAYYLFGQITSYRYEVTFQSFDGNQWTSHHMKYKPGDPKAPPSFVAPHQPRVDFRLWFYPLSLNPEWDARTMQNQARRRMPRYVVQILSSMCHEPTSVDSLFAEPLPQKPKAVRIQFKDYRFTSPEEREQTGHWWNTNDIADTGSISCTHIRKPRRLKANKSPQ